MEKIDAIGGFINVLKPTGMTSSNVVVAVKKTLGLKKVGHLGTLDPAASGVLPIAFGKATKFFDYFLKKDKQYVAVVQFGIETDTLDSFGNITNKNNKIVTKTELNDILKLFTGKIKQVPPKYSAIKINGAKAYELARSGLDVTLEPHDIEIYSIKLMDELSENRFRFCVNCSAGTYIRTLFDDIAKKLGTHATTTVIIRTKSGCFCIDDAITLEELKANPKFIMVDEALNDLKKYEITDESVLKKILNGVKLTKNELNLETQTDKFFIENNGKIIGLYHFEENRLICDVFLH